MHKALHRHTKSLQIQGDRTADQAKTNDPHTVTLGSNPPVVHARLHKPSHVDQP